MGSDLARYEPLDDEDERPEPVSGNEPVDLQPADFEPDDLEPVSPAGGEPYESGPGGSLRELSGDAEPFDDANRSGVFRRFRRPRGRHRF